MARRAIGESIHDGQRRRNLLRQFVRVTSPQKKSRPAAAYRYPLNCVPASRRHLDRLAVDAGLVLWIVDGDVGVVPGEARPDAETLGQFSDALLGVPGFRGLARKGLIRKDYLNGESGTGGVYLWDSRQSAEAWFTEERIAQLTERFAVRPRLTWYDTHVTVDNLKDETRVNGKAIEAVA